MLSLLSITCVDRVPIGTNDAHRTRDGLIDPNTSPAVVSAFRWTGYPRLRALRRWSAGDPARPSSSIRTYRAVGLASLCAVASRRFPGSGETAAARRSGDQPSAFRVSDRRDGAVAGG